ncbi:hypothetical protein TNCV_2215781 [Trichonephila clavipes]|nr:hypothetical protein TNCV_2215781 [Trichonephila clavipes]
MLDPWKNVACSYESRAQFGRHLSSLDQVSDFNRGRIVAYSDCGLSFRKMGQRVGRNQAPVMQICHHWIQE